MFNPLRTLLAMALGAVVPLAALVPSPQTPGPPQAAPGPVDFPAVATRMQAEAKADLFGGVVLVVRGDQVLFEQAVGQALRWAKLPITRDTRFQLASLGKLFTTVAIAQLVEQGRVGLDDPITKYLPAQAQRPGWPKVLVRHLLTHRSGFGSYWGDDFVARRTSIRAVKDYFPLFESKPLAFEPGTRFEYSNVGFILLGAIIEQASGEDYFAYIQKHVFDPAGMKDSGFFEADEDTPRLAVGYTLAGPDGKRMEGPARTHAQRKPFKGGPAGDSISTAPDLVRFAQALLSGKLLKRATLEQFLAAEADLPTPPGSRWKAFQGLGFMGRKDGSGRRLVGHTGGFVGTSTSLLMDPDTGLVAVMLANVDPQLTMPLEQLVREALPR